MGLLTEAPYIPTGAHHIPMITSVNYKYYRTPRASTRRLPRQVKLRCIDEFRQETPLWQCCEHDINQALQMTDDLFDLQKVNQILVQGTMHFFQRGQMPGSPAKMGFAEQKWQHCAHFRQAGNPTLFNLFQTWRHFVLFHKMDTLHVRWVKQIKQSKIQQLTMEAQTAFQHHDSFKLYHAISRACPKHRHKRVHLKTEQGEFMSPTEETAAYVKYIADNWTGPPIEIPELPTPGVLFTLHELEQVIATIPSTKAVAPGFAPGPMWKSQSPVLAEWLFRLLHEWWHQNPTYISISLERCVGMLASQTSQTFHQA